MPSTDPRDRPMVARIAATERWGRKPNRTAATAPARAGVRAKFAREADPNGILDPIELERRVDSLMRAHMIRMSLKAKSARRKAAEPTRAGDNVAAELAEAGGPDAA